MIIFEDFKKSIDVDFHIRQIVFAKIVGLIVDDVMMADSFSRNSFRISSIAVFDLQKPRYTRARGSLAPPSAGLTRHTEH